MKVSFTDLCFSGYPLVWVTTSEALRAERDLSTQLQRDWAERGYEDGLTLLRWDILRGMVDINTNHNVCSPDPIESINYLPHVQGELVICFFYNLHRFCEPGVVQAILNNIDIYKRTGKVLVALCPDSNIPSEIEKYTTVFDFHLPDEQKLMSICQSVCEAAEYSPSEEEVKALSRAGKGLSEFEFENSLALSFATEGKPSCSVIYEMKEQLVRKTEALEFFKPSEIDRFSYIGGLENLKRFCLSTCRSPLSRGVLLLGVPGTGKSAFAKALGGEAGLPTLSLNVGAVFGSLVGESERRIREALKVVEALAPCVLFIDEIEKGLAGVEASGRTDSGVTARVVGTFLTWMQDCPAHVYTVATCNSIDKLPPEMLRAERWDAIFFIDLPTPSERKAIWEIWGKYYNVNLKNLPADHNWTGAEIRTCCRLSAMMNRSPVEASQYIVPLANTMSEKIEYLRRWAEGRAIPASTPPAQAEQVRKIKRR